MQSKKQDLSKIVVKKFVFKYSPGTFSDYWNNYKKHLSKPLKEKFDSLTKFQKANLREMVKDKTLEYTKKKWKNCIPMGSTSSNSQKLADIRHKFRLRMHLECES
ncbi:MAG: hypothetical protein Ct9H300mP17_16260 [Candidatus Nitrosopelagicus sp.]|nr:MAG: hypothetical protein Ct9H300mP17_16260 [Candidatus Nitrosopelagicus sp.]